ncbi:hypothetical protein Aperf_G00000053611 [Anoplocephala perfoliata]
MLVFSVLLFLLVTGFSDVLGEVYFEDRFLNKNIDQWTISEKEPEKLGKCEFDIPASIFDEKEDGGMNTTEAARFYRYSAPFKRTFKNKDKNMCVQFSVKYPFGAECGGAYVKLMGEDFKAGEFNGETPYEIMFGPDVCGYDTRMVHVIFSYEGKNHLVKEKVPFLVNNMTHLFTLHVFPNNTFAVLVDRELKRNGSLVDDFDMLLPKMIDDPESKKPEDWVDNDKIPDPEDKKPDDWDQPETIVDTNATKPQDWNDETDGEWTAPMIANPKYKGDWVPRMIRNPKYMGEWKPRRIDNPHFVDDPNLYSRSFAFIGIDLWQVQSGTLFDNFIVSDDLNECEDHAKYWKKRFDAEVEMMKNNSEAGRASPEDFKEKDSGDKEMPPSETSINIDELWEETEKSKEESEKGDEDKRFEEEEKEEVEEKKKEKLHEEL